MPNTVMQLREDDKAFDGFSRAQVCMVVTNPNLDDTQIACENQAFNRVTGYAQSASVGRNCHFLEGEGTANSDLSRIIGMIRQQCQTTSVPEGLSALSRRIETMQLLYEEMKLSDSHSNRNSIQMGRFISRLCAAIAHFESRPGIRLSLHVEALELPMETATRVGLVVSELVTNAYTHAFDRMDMGLVEIRMSRLSEGGLRMHVSDDGIGISRNRQWPDHSTVGGRLISDLIEGLEGTLNLTRGAAGSVITIDVPASATITD